MGSPVFLYTFSNWIVECWTWDSGLSIKVSQFLNQDLVGLCGMGGLENGIVGITIIDMHFADRSRLSNTDILGTHIP